MEQAVREFFEAYARRFEASLSAPSSVDVDAVVDSFAPCFVESSPVGVGVPRARNGLLFRWMVPRGFARYRKIGTRRMRIDAMEITELDPMHAASPSPRDAQPAARGAPVLSRTNSSTANSTEVLRSVWRRSTLSSKA